jgi:hypothetical protein
MKLESRVPYLDDNEFTAAVIGIMSGRGFAMSEENERYVSESVARKKQAELGYEPPSNNIDISIGQIEDISMGEARVIREEFAKGVELKTISKSMKISVDLVIAVIEGKVWPYAGGPLKRLMRVGLNETGYTANQRKFISAVLRLAKREFTAQQFEVVVDSNGLSYADVTRLLLNSERNDGRETAHRRRFLLRRHAEGEDIEKCAAAFQRRNSGSRA